LCASVGNKKGSVLLMHGVTMKFMICNILYKFLQNRGSIMHVRAAWKLLLLWDLLIKM